MIKYQAGGKGIAPRKSDKPSWVGLEELSRTQFTVTFKTKTGYKMVPLYQVERWEKIVGEKTK